MTEKEKMEKGELYDAAIPELIEQFYLPEIKFLNSII